LKVLLTTLNAKYIHINLAVRLLYHLNKDKHNIAYKEFSIKEDKDTIAAYCANFELLAFSCYIWNITQTIAVIKKIKALNPNIKILLGGPEVSYEWEKIIAIDEIDFIITGEGEIPFGHFLEAYPNVDLIPNLVSKKNGEVKYIEQSVTFDVKNYAHIMPYQNDEVTALKNKVCYIETSRGCPYKCEFCLASLDNKVRYLPNEAIKANLLHLMQHGKVIKFLDRTFNVKKDFTIDIFKFILENHRPGNVFQFEITADIVHPEIIQFINDHVPPGLFRFEIGIQTVNQKANLEVSRKQNFEKTKKVIEQLHHKIEMHLDLIVGLPHDYYQDIKYSFEEVFKIFPSELQLGFLKFLKGTPVRLKYETHGYKFDPEPPYQIIESNYLSKQELHQISLLEEALEIYWNKKRAISTLKYVTVNYSIFDFMLGLAVYFNTKSDFHQHSLANVYQLLNEFVAMNYNHDIKLKQLIAIDYYMAHKVKPQLLFLKETSNENKQELIQQHQLNLHKFRYLFFEIDFNYTLFKEQQILKEGKNNIILKYTGTDYAEVLI
jgi:anaerobic magnesium-protoporphyrin IX monomethyl ester cyclase